MCEVNRLFDDLHSLIEMSKFTRFATPLGPIEITKSTNTLTITQLDRKGNIDYVIDCKYDPTSHRKMAYYPKYNLANV